MTTRELYTKGARVWIPHKQTIWQPGVLLSDLAEDGGLIVELEEAEDEEEEIIEIDTSKTPNSLPPLRNPEILIGENDLTTLSYLHEPAVLYNLKVRFLMHNAIYTYSGIVLVAINPYEQLPLYGADIIAAYSGHSQGEMDPHIFAVAEEAYRTMARHSQNQSLIVSGESGAGKTVSAKYAMRYFATVGGAEGETQIEKKVLASNPIMESIGNAKTIRNDNSSRFGKYIQIFFDKYHHIIGAHMRTYLLEKSRVVFQAPEERNYHIFYQLCASSDLPELKELRLGHPDEFFYLCQGQSPFVNDVDDAECFEEVRSSLDLVGITEEQQRIIFRILAAILHLGNVIIYPGENEDESGIEEDDISLIILTSLLGIDKYQLQHWLCNRKIVAMREVLIKPQNKEESVNARDALSKHIYAQLFQWIVKAVNKTLSTGIQHDHFIGVLDIYGFETFEVNSFEQFCINFANEKLQQQFTQHVFKLEQEEYVREQIEWSFINFYDNQPCIDLIQSKLGILDLLDEECKMPKGSDEQWARKIFQRHLGKSRHLSKPRMSSMAFIIEHFADMVKYDVSGFMEKNRDTVNEEHLAILRASEYELVAELFTDEVTPEPVKNTTRMRLPPRNEKTSRGPQNTKSKQSVGSQFSLSLNKLMETLNSTTPHYIRCIKPNDLKAAFEFDPPRVMQQLRACGVLETVKISAAGYPSRWSYPDFFHRYRMLIRFADVKWKDVKQTCDRILKLTVKDPDKFQCGKTKIFFRAGQVAYLEKLRSDRLYESCVTIQKNYRGWYYYKRYQRMRKAAILIQSWVRGMQARSLANFLRRTKAAICIQKTFRGYVSRRRYRAMRRASVTIQSYYRGTVARRLRSCLLYDAKARVIQRAMRRYAARKTFIKKIKSIIFLQSCVRRMYARRELKRLKIEARSVEHYKTVTKGMENKIISLQQRLDEEVKQKEQLQSNQKKIEGMQQELANTKQLKNEHQAALTKVGELEKALTKLWEDLENETSEKEAIQEKYETEKSEKDLELESMKRKMAELTEEYNYTVKKVENGVTTIEALTMENKQLKQEKAEIAHELELEQGHRQRLINEHERLKQRYDNLHEEMQLVVHSPVKTPTRSKSFEASAVAELIKEGALVVSPEDKLKMEESESTIASLKEKISFLEKEKEIQLNAEKKKLHLELDKLNKKIKELYAEREAEKEIIDESEKAFEALKRQIRDLVVERDAFRNKLQALKSEGIIPSQDIEKMEVAVEMENQIRRTAELEEWEARMKEKEKVRLFKEKKEQKERDELAILQAIEREQKEKLHQQVLAQYAEREKLYTNKIKEMIAENKSVSEELTVQQDYVKELQTECDTNKTCIDELENELHKFRLEMKDLQVERDVYREKLSKLEMKGIIPTIIVDIENEVERLNEERRRSEMIEWEERLKQKEKDREERIRKENKEREERAKQIAVENEERSRREEKNLEQMKALADENRNLNGQLIIFQRVISGHGAERDIVQTKLNEVLEQKDGLLHDNDRLKSELIKMASIAHDIINMDAMKYDTMDENAYMQHIGTLKQANGVLQRELEVTLKRGKDHEDKMERIRKELEDSKLSKASQAVQLDTNVQKELSRLVEENLKLREEVENLVQRVKQLERELHDEQVGEVVYRPRSISTHSKEEQRRRGQSFLASDLKAGRLVMTYAGLLRKNTKTEEDLLPPPPSLTIQGMVEYCPEDEGDLIDKLIVNLKPATVADHIPGLPAHILFMCIRYVDRLSDDRAMQSLVTNAINAIKKVTKKNQSNLDMLAFWLSNTCRLVHDMKQYSGESTFQNHNTPEQNEQCLTNFDLTQYRQVLGDTAIATYQDLVKCVWLSLQDMIVPGMLEYESIPGVTTSKRVGRNRATSKSNPDTVITSKTITNHLSHVLAVLNTHCVDPEIIKQIFRQTFYFIGALMMNNLLLRKDMCHWSKGMQIRFNLSQLEDWVRVNQLDGSGIVEALECITQAAQLLQVSKKTLEDVNAICEVCSSLNTLQVQKILNMYTPAGDHESRVPAKVVRAVVERGHNKVEPVKLMMDINHQYPINIPFTPCAVTFDTVKIPDTLQLDFIKVV